MAISASSTGWILSRVAASRSNSTRTKSKRLYSMRSPKNSLRNVWVHVTSRCRIWYNASPASPARRSWSIGRRISACVSSIVRARSLCHVSLPGRLFSGRGGAPRSGPYSCNRRPPLCRLYVLSTHSSTMGSLHTGHVNVSSTARRWSSQVARQPTWNEWPHAPLVGERNDAQVAVFIARVVKPELLPADSTLGARLFVAFGQLIKLLASELFFQVLPLLEDHARGRHHELVKP